MNKFKRRYGIHLLLITIIGFFLSYMTKDAGLFGAFGSLIIIYAMYTWKRDYASFEIEGRSLNKIEAHEQYLMKHLVSIGVNAKRIADSIVIDDYVKFEDFEVEYEVEGETIQPVTTDVKLQTLFDFILSVDERGHKNSQDKHQSMALMISYISESNKMLELITKNSKTTDEIKSAFINVEALILMYGTLIWGFGDRIMKLFI